jgi:MFS family permease
MERKTSFSALAPFRRRLFLAIWIATLISNMGGMIQVVGASWMMATVSGSSAMIGLVQTASTLPIMLSALAAGVVADLFDRRLVMLSAQLLMFAASIALALTSYAGLATPWFVIAMIFLVGCGTALNGPAWQASVGEHVPRQELSAAIALNATGFNVARSAGPALGGVLVALFGVPVAFAVNAVSYVGLIAVLLSWKRVPPRRTLPAETLRAALVTGVRFVMWAPLTRAPIVRGLAFGIAGSAAWALMPVIARDKLQGGAVVYGLLFAAFGAGAIWGAITSGMARDRWGPESVVRTALAISAFGTVTVGISTNLPISLVAAGLLGSGWVLTLSTCNATVQLLCPRWVIARALAVYQTFAFGGVAIGSIAWGLVSDRWGLFATFLASGVVLIGTAFLGLVYPLPRESDADISPAQNAPRAQRASPLPDGKIAVQNSYSGANAGRPDYKNALLAMRSMRLRNGARQWRFVQDPADPDRRLEEFVMADALEHERMYRRMTRSDVEIEERFRALQQS